MTRKLAIADTHTHLVLQLSCAVNGFNSVQIRCVGISYGVLSPTVLYTSAATSAWCLAEPTLLSRLELTAAITTVRHANDCTMLSQSTV